MEIRLGPARKNRRLDEASSAARITVDHDTRSGHGRPFTASSSKKPLTRTSQDSLQLYAQSISDMHDASGEGKERGGDIGRDLSKDLG